MLVVGGHLHGYTYLCMILRFCDGAEQNLNSFLRSKLHEE